MSSSWRVFIDDSADGQRKQFVIAGALIGRKDEWHTFTKKWRKVLHARPVSNTSIKKISSSLRGEFWQFRDQNVWPPPSGREAAFSKRDALRSVIQQITSRGCRLRVLVPDYERVRETHPREKSPIAKDVFESALRTSITQAVAGWKKTGSNRKNNLYLRPFEQSIALL